MNGWKPAIFGAGTGFSWHFLEPRNSFLSRYAKYSFRGRIWAQFLALFGEGCFLFVFACVSNEYQWYHALAALVCFSLCVQMAEG